MSNLQLSLKKQWFELTKSGVKTEDYRELNEYWYNRLVDRKNLRAIKKAQIAFIIEMAKDQEGLSSSFWKNANDLYAGCFKPFKKNTMTLGYPKSTDSERILKLEHKGIEIREGNPEWGAIPGRKYFVILHGSFLK